MTPTVVVMASGGGTTAEAFIRAYQRGDIKARVTAVIVSRSDAGIFGRIESINRELGLDIPCHLINHKTHPAAEHEIVERGAQTAAEQDAILELIEAGSYDVVALMGYMKRVGDKLIDAYGWKPEYTSIYEASMVNTHPGILPDTKAMFGLNIQKYVLDHGLPYGGQTLHLVSKEYDAGPIIAEHRVMVLPGDTSASLFDRVQQAEKKYMPSDIDAFLDAKIAYSRSMSHINGEN